MLMQSNTTGDGQVPSNLEQRLTALEGSVADLSEANDRLYRMLKEQGELINEYITRQLVAGGSDRQQDKRLPPEDALFTFVCRRKFNQVEEELGRLRQVLAGLHSASKAG